MVKLRFSLIKSDRKLEFTITEQSPLYSPSREYKATNGLCVASETCPELSPHTIFLRGSDISADSKTVECIFRTNKARDEYYERAIFALCEWADRAPEFRKPPTVKKADTEPGEFILK
jgi:hypothetical protein